MTTLGFSVGPLLVLAGVWMLLMAHDGAKVDRRKAVQLGIGCLVAAVLVTAGAVLAPEDVPAEPRKVPTTST